MSEYEPQRDPEPSGWAIAGVSFAAVMLMTIGIFQALSGLAAIINDEFFVVGSKYAFNLDVSGWGWIHLILGIVLVFGGWALFAGKTWARVLGIILAVLSAIANFFYIPYYPFWAVLIIALDVWVIWALTRPGLRERA
jgi:hypothetical protein